MVIETGNPADSERFLPMLERHIAFYGEAPRQAAADGGFASRQNLSQAKAHGVQDVAFHKKAGLRIEDMVKNRWIYRKLRNFRAGIEAGISWIKRSFGLARCTWRGLDHFKAYIWSSNCRRRCTRKRRQNPATASTPSTTRSAAKTFWRTPMLSAAPTRARRTFARKSGAFER